MAQIKRYQWPASRLTSQHMAVLVELRKKEGKPISEILADLILKAKEDKEVK